MPSGAYLGDQLRKQRQHSEMTRETLAELLGIDVGIIDRIENGDIQPEPALVLQMAQVLSCEVDELTGPSQQSMQPPKDPWRAFFELADEFDD